MTAAMVYFMFDLGFGTDHTDGTETFALVGVRGTNIQVNDGRIVETREGLIFRQIGNKAKFESFYKCSNKDDDSGPCLPKNIFDSISYGGTVVCERRYRVSFTGWIEMPYFYRNCR